MDEYVDAIFSMFPAEWVRETAKETGFIERERKIDPMAFLFAMVFKYGNEVKRNLASLKRNYERIDEVTLSDGSWYDRFTPELVEFLHACVCRAIEHLAQGATRNLQGQLASFKDVLIQDSTIVRLHESLSDEWPAARSRKGAAGVKVSTLYSAKFDGPQRVEINGERTSETKTLKIGPWVKDSVLLFDLGFYKHQAFARIVENGGSFVTRLKGNANPTIVASNVVHRGRSIDIDGESLREIESWLGRKEFDAYIEIGFDRRKYNGKSRRDSMHVRLVGMWDTEDKKYHFYVTNIAPDVLSTSEVAALYRCRWEIEMVFKELKSKYDLDQLKTSSKHAVLALIWVSILTLLVSRRMYHVLRRLAPPDVKPVRFTHLRWANTFMETSPFVLYGLLSRMHDDWDPNRHLQLLMEISASQALDPHIERHRPLEDYWQ